MPKGKKWEVVHLQSGHCLDVHEISVRVIKEGLEHLRIGWGCPDAEKIIIEGHRGNVELRLTMAHIICAALNQETLE